MKRILALTALFITAQAQAYIPPTQFMLKQMAAKRNNLKNLWQRSFVVGYEGERPSATTRFRVTVLYDAATHVLQSWASDENEQKLYMVERNAKTLTPVDQLILENRADDLTRILKSRRVPIKTDQELLDLRDEPARRAAEETTLVRFRNTFAWLIGSASGPGLWVEKDTFLPLRFIFSRPADNDDVDVVFDGFRFMKEVPVPRAIIVAKKGNLPMFREDLNDVATNQPDLKMEKKISHGFTDKGNQLPQAMRDLIHQYYLTLR